MEKGEVIVSCKICKEPILYEKDLEKVEPSIIDKALKKVGIKKVLDRRDIQEHLIVGTMEKHIAKHPKYIWQNGRRIGRILPNKSKQEVLSFWLGAFDINLQLLKEKYGITL